MLFEEDQKIELLINNLNHPAAIRDRNGKHLYLNDKWKEIVGDVENITLKELCHSVSDEILKTNMSHCMTCDEKAFLALEPVLNLEVFNTRKYLTSRTSISYRSKSALLIIVIELF